MDNMDDNLGGRVTRSLRKRLNSVDTETASRPGTPSIDAGATPIKAVRTTRRNSLSAPGTPRLIGTDLTPDVNSPSRRITRRRNSLISDDTPLPQSKLIKQPAFEILEEEELERPKTPKQENNENSPPATIGSKRRGRPKKSIEGDKKETNEQNSNIVINNSVPEEIEIISTNEVPLKKNDDDKQKITNVHDGHDLPLSTEVVQKQDTISEQTKSNNEVSTSENAYIISEQKKYEDSTLDNQNEEDKEYGKTNKNDFENLSKGIIEDKELTEQNNIETNQNVEESNNPEISIVKNISMGKLQSPSTNTPKSYKKQSVSFENVIDDTLKCVYPRTPFVKKSKSFIDSNSSKELKQKSFDSNKSIFDTSKNDEQGDELEIPETQEVHVHSVNENVLMNDVSFNEKTPHKAKLLGKEMQTSTPLLETSKADPQISNNKITTKYDDDLIEEKCLPSPNINVSENSTIEIEVNASSKTASVAKEKDSTLLETMSPKKISQSIRFENHSKIDTIKSLSHVDDNSIQKLLPTNSNNGEGMNIDEEDDDREIINVFSSFENEATEEECVENTEENEFIDNEAAEIENYQSGDSMDEEERREIEQNEIKICGEDIGSDDTDDPEEVDEESNCSFIVDDDVEESEQFKFSDDNDEENDKYKGKKSYSRIQIMSSDDTDVEENYSKEVSKETATVTSEQQKNLLNDKPMIISVENVSISPIKVSEASFSKEIEQKKNEEKHSIHDISSKTNSKLNDSALKLAYESDSSANEEAEEDIETLNASRKSLIKELNRSERFNKTTHELNPEQTETSAETNGEEEPLCSTTKKCRGLSSSMSFMIEKRKPLSHLKMNKSLHEISTTSDEDRNESEFNLQKYKRVNQKSDKDENKVLDQSKEVNISMIDVGIAPKKRKSRSKANYSITEEPLINNDEDTNVTVKEESEDILENEYSEISDENMTTSKALSVSLDQIVGKKNTKTNKRHSFTIGVSVKTQENIDSVPSEDPISNDDQILIDAMSNNQRMQINSHRSRRQTMLTLQEGNDDKLEDSTNTLKKKRYSLMHNNEDGYNPTNSFLEAIDERKRELKADKNKHKRSSQSFVESLDSTEVELDTHHKHEIPLFEIEDKAESSIAAVNSHTPQNNQNSNNGNKINTAERIMNKCSEILEAANRAKLEQKLQARKNLMNVRKRTKKQKINKTLSKDIDNANEKKEQQQKNIIKNENINEAVAKAFIASKEILSKQGVQKKSKPTESIDVKQVHNMSSNISQVSSTKNMENICDTEIDSHRKESKRLAHQMMNSISSANPLPKRKKKNDYFNVNTESMNVINKFKSAAGDIVVTPLTPIKKKKPIETFTIPTGIVRVDPLTPKTQINAIGPVRQSPITPRTIGSKVRHIISAGQKNPNDLLKQHKNIKRKREVEEPNYALPQPKWSQSGFFAVEKLQASRSVGRGGATEFIVSTLDKRRQGKKNANDGMILMKDSYSRAMQFKNEAQEGNRVPRESARELIQRKQRTAIRNF